jgi:hypothetical protein
VITSRKMIWAGPVVKLGWRYLSCSDRSAVAGSVKTVMDFIANKKGGIFMTNFSKASLSFRT